MAFKDLPHTTKFQTISGKSRRQICKNMFYYKDVHYAVSGHKEQDGTKFNIDIQ